MLISVYIYYIAFIFYYSKHVCCYIIAERQVFYTAVQLYPMDNVHYYYSLCAATLYGERCWLDIQLWGLWSLLCLAQLAHPLAEVCMYMTLLALLGESLQNLKKIVWFDILCVLISIFCNILCDLWDIYKSIYMNCSTVSVLLLFAYYKLKFYKI